MSRVFQLQQNHTHQSWWSALQNKTISHNCCFLLLLLSVAWSAQTQADPCLRMHWWWVLALAANRGWYKYWQAGTTWYHHHRHLQQCPKAKAIIVPENPRRSDWTGLFPPSTECLGKECGNWCLQVFYSNAKGQSWQNWQQSLCLDNVHGHCTSIRQGV